MASVSRVLLEVCGWFAALSSPAAVAVGANTSSIPPFSMSPPRIIIAVVARRRSKPGKDAAYDDDVFLLLAVVTMRRWSPMPMPMPKRADGIVENEDEDVTADDDRRIMAMHHHGDARLDNDLLGGGDSILVTAGVGIRHTAVCGRQSVMVMVEVDGHGRWWWW